MNVHVVGLHGLSRGGKRHGHRGFLRQNLGEQALVFRVQVLNHDESHAGCGNGAEQLTERFEAGSGRGADSHDEEGRVATGFRQAPTYRPATMDDREYGGRARHPPDFQLGKLRFIDTGGIELIAPYNPVVRGLVVYRPVTELRKAMQWLLQSDSEWLDLKP